MLAYIARRLASTVLVMGIVAVFVFLLLHLSPGDPAAIIDRAYRLAFSRPPTRAERGAGIEFLAQQNRQRSARNPKQPRDEIRWQALTDYCQVLFGLNEFIYVD